MGFKLHPWKRSAGRSGAAAGRSGAAAGRSGPVRTLARTAFDSLGVEMPPALKLEARLAASAPSSQLTGAQRAKRLRVTARLRITALSGLREDDNLDLPQVDPETSQNGEN